MIFDYPRGFPADAIEQSLPTPADARRVLATHDDALEAMLAERRRDLATFILGPDDEAALAHTADAARLAYARLAVRHGRLGTDFHAYHNEGHILEICADRIPRVLALPGARDAFAARRLRAAAVRRVPRPAPARGADVRARHRRERARQHRGDAAHPRCVWIHARARRRFLRGARAHDRRQHVRRPLRRASVQRRRARAERRRARREARHQARQASSGLAPRSGAPARPAPRVARGGSGYRERRRSIHRVRDQWREPLPRT